MRVLVCPHQMGMGGSQLTAIELAAAMRNEGHEVTLYAPDGQLAERATGLGLDRVTAPDPVGSINTAWIRGLGAVVRERRIDLVHAYEWEPCVEAAIGAGVMRRTPVLMSIMAMAVPRFLPRHLPIVVGTPALARQQRAVGRQAFLLEPVVDMSVHRSRDVAAARARWEIPDDTLVVSTVSMLTTELEKLQGVLALIAMIDRLAGEYPVRLLIAGTGEGLEQVCLRAKRVNERHGRPVVHPLGFRADPTDVYEAADIVVGMGGSAIKGLAFGKPLIVQGEAGYWRALRPQNAVTFLHHGWFGSGGAGARDLELELRELLDDAVVRTEMGWFGRELVRPRYSLARATRRLNGIYAQVLAERAPLARAASSWARSVVDLTRYRLHVRMGDVVKQERSDREGMVNP